MSILFFLLLVAILFTWLVVRSVRAGHGKSLLWLAWLLLGTAWLLGAADPRNTSDRVLSQLWAYSLIGLPVWWAIQALRRGGRRS